MGLLIWCAMEGEGILRAKMVLHSMVKSAPKLINAPVARRYIHISLDMCPANSLCPYKPHPWLSLFLCVWFWIRATIKGTITRRIERVCFRSKPRKSAWHTHTHTHTHA